MILKRERFLLQSADNNLQLRGLLVDHSGAMWLHGRSTFTKYEADLDRWTHFENSPLDTTTVHVGDKISTYQDRSGLIWVGSECCGVGVFNPLPDKFPRLKPDVSDVKDHGSLNIGAVYETDDAVWMTSRLALIKFDRQTGENKTYSHEPSDPSSLGEGHSLVALDKDSQGNFWLGGTGGTGLNYFDQTNEAFVVYRHDPNDPNSLSDPDDSVLSIRVDNGNGLIWVGTRSGGLNLFDPDSETFQVYKHDPNDSNSLVDNNVRVIHIDSSGVLWLGSWFKGLTRFDPKDGLFTRFQHDPLDTGNSLASNTIYAINEDRDGTIWVGTSAGLSKFYADRGSFLSYREKNGLPGDSIRGIIPDDQGYLWLSTNRGISKFDYNEIAFENFDITDGLQSNEFSENAYFKGATGELFFSGPEGVNVFSPENMARNLYPPPVLITEFLLFNESVPIENEGALLAQDISVTDQISLDHTQSVFTIKFSAFSYLYPEKNRFAYKLEGFDSDWILIDSNNPSATYTNLDPDTYIFHVKARNNDGVWNEVSQTLTINVIPPWWQTWWAYSAYIIASMSMILGVIRWRTYQTEAANRQLETLVAARTRDLKLSSEVARQATTELDIYKLLPQLTEKMQKAFDLYFVSVFLYDSDSESLVLEAGNGRTEHLINKNVSFHIDEQPSLVAKAGREKRHVVINDVSSEPVQELNADLPDTQSEIVLPMLVGDNLIGVLNMHSEVKDRFTQNDIEIYSTLAEQIAIAVNNAQLYASQITLAKELRQADQVKTQFLSSMSHELRTPLNGIINFTEMVASGMIGDVNEEQRELLGYSLESSEHLLSLINDVLDITKIQAGQLNLFLEDDTNIYDELMSVIYIISPMIRNEQVTLVKDIDDNLPLIRADRRRIRQIFLNLASNAVKFTHEGTITICAKYQKDHILFAFIDTGPGISEEMQSAIFEPFVQAVDGIKAAEGTGLGLPITKSLVEAHGGRLWIESKEGEGSAFFIRLPIPNVASTTTVKG